MIFILYLINDCLLITTERNKKKTEREQSIYQRLRKQKEYNLSLTFKQLLSNAFIHHFSLT